MDVCFIVNDGFDLDCDLDFRSIEFVPNLLPIVGSLHVFISTLLDRPQLPQIPSQSRREMFPDNSTSTPVVSESFPHTRPASRAPRSSFTSKEGNFRRRDLRNLLLKIGTLDNNAQVFTATLGDYSGRDLF